MLITGGAGFIGVNAARYFAGHDWRITVLDNLSRKGADQNLRWLQSKVPISFEQADVRDKEHIERVLKSGQPDVVLHLAAQVAVTTSVVNPREDFEINALGTLNVLEAVRQHSPASFFINASTNKVYGKMHDVAIVERNNRYEYRDLDNGVSEDFPLDFHSPYGCSKGVADQYTIDYSRIYGLKTVTMRQSCIYGPRQFGVEDQGWVAWFSIAAVLGKAITIYGDGKQIRDVLHVEDLIRAYELAIACRTAVSGRAFNIGGGAANTLSLLELIAMLQTELNVTMSLTMGDWRLGDQRVFVCDLARAKKAMDWRPAITATEGVARLIAWIKANNMFFQPSAHSTG